MKVRVQELATIMKERFGGDLVYAPIHAAGAGGGANVFRPVFHLLPHDIPPHIVSVAPQVLRRQRDRLEAARCAFSMANVLLLRMEV